MKKIYSGILTLALCLALIAPASAVSKCEETYLATRTNNTIVVSSSTDVPDAHLVHPAVYKIEGSNYFKLRDVAMMLSGSAKQFSVEYDDAAKSVSITTGKPYKALGGELSGTAAEKSSATVSNNAIIIDGRAVTLTVYKIDGANYFKLRDLGKALDFHVGYDDQTKTVYVSGARNYEDGNDPGVIGYTPRKDGSVLEEPPTLSVSILDKSIEVSHGTCSWSYASGSVWVGIETDSLHPLDNAAKKYMPGLELEASELSAKDARCLLSFSEIPDGISARCWGAEHRGDTGAQSEPVAVSDFAMELKAGAYIYEVTAVWNRPEYKGRVYYSFYVNAD